MNLWNSILRFLGQYDSNGLRHSKKHLEKIRYSIAFYTLTAQAEYADEYTVKNIKNTSFLKLLCYGEISLEQNKMSYYVEHNIIDATVVGNLAFIALNSTDKELRLKCVDLLDEYRIYIKKYKMNY